MTENRQPLRRELDEVTRVWDARYGALREKLKEYDVAVEEKERLVELASDLEKQVERVKEQIEGQKHIIKEIEQELRPQLDVFKSTTGSGDEAASSTPPIVQETITTVKTQPRAAPRSEEDTPNHDKLLLTALGHEALSKTPMMSVTEQTAQRVIADVEKVHGLKLTSGQIKAILVNYPHGYFNDGEFYFRKCKECGANAGVNKQGAGMHFIQGDMGMVRHMRRHGHLSGLNAKNIDQYCTMGERASGMDLIRISEGRQPLKPETMTLGERKLQTNNRKSQSTEQVITYENDSDTPSRRSDTSTTKTKSKPLSNQLDNTSKNNPGGGVKQKRTRTSSNTTPSFGAFDDSPDDQPRKRARKSKPIYRPDYIPTDEIDFDGEYVTKDEVKRDGR